MEIKKTVPQAGRLCSIFFCRRVFCCIALVTSCVQFGNFLVLDVFDHEAAILADDNAHVLPSPFCEPLIYCVTLKFNVLYFICQCVILYAQICPSD